MIEDQGEEMNEFLLEQTMSSGKKLTICKVQRSGVEESKRTRKLV